MRICSECEAVAQELYTFRDGVPIHIANICKNRHLQIVEYRFTQVFPNEKVSDAKPEDK